MATKRRTQKPAAKHRPNSHQHRDIGGIAQAVSYYMNGVADRTRYKLIKIDGIFISDEPHQGHIQHEYHEAYICPAHLGHVKVFPDFVRLITVDDNFIDITKEEWNRIQSAFGYSDPSKLSFESLINAQCSPEESIE